MKTTYSPHPAVALDFSKASRNAMGLDSGDQHCRLESEEPNMATQRLMAELGIAFDGRYYRYEEYRYDRFVDAINYAQLFQSRSVMPPTL